MRLSLTPLPPSSALASACAGLHAPPVTVGSSTQSVVGGCVRKPLLPHTMPLSVDLPPQQGPAVAAVLTLSR